MANKWEKNPQIFHLWVILLRLQIDIYYCCSHPFDNFCNTHITQRHTEYLHVSTPMLTHWWEIQVQNLYFKGNVVILMSLVPLNYVCGLESLSRLLMPDYLETLWSTRFVQALKKTWGNMGGSPIGEGMHRLPHKHHFSATSDHFCPFKTRLTIMSSKRQKQT